MELRLAVCPHYTEKGLNKWQALARDLEKLLGKSVKFEPFKDFGDEKEKLQTQTYDVYYANIFTAKELHKKGYRAVGVYTDEREEGIFIKRKGEEIGKPIVLAAVNVPAFILSLFRAGLNVQDIEILSCNSFNMVLDELKLGRANVGFVFGEFYEHAEDTGNFEEFAKINLPKTHFFMVHPDAGEEVVKALLSLPYVRGVGPDEFEYATYFGEIGELFLSLKEKAHLETVLGESPHMGLVIYKDKILYANRFFIKLLGYTKKELSRMSVLDLLATEDMKSKCKVAIDKQLNGKRLNVFYPELKVITKNKDFKYIMNYTTTILYEGSYAGLSLFIDITRQKKSEKLKDLLHKVNRAIFGITDEETLYEKLCKVLVDEVGLRMVWVGAPDESGWFKVLYSHGHVSGYLDNIRIYKSTEIPEGRGPTTIAYSTGNVVINEDTRTNPAMAPWRDEMLKRGYLSSAAIPLRKEGKIVSVINLYSEEPNFFDEETRQVIEQVGKDISLYLDFLSIVKKATIISSALEKSSSMVVITDEKGNIVYVNDAVVKITGYTKEELIGKTPRVFKSGYHSKAFYKNLWETITSGKEFNAILVNRKKSGETYYSENRIFPVELPNGERMYVGISRDITKEIYLSEEVEKLRRFDPITELYNYRGFSLLVSDVLDKTEEGLLIVVDINGMSYINKVYGIPEGDKVIKETAKRLKTNLGDDAIIGRMGGDEFAVFIPLEREKATKYALVVDSNLQEIFKEPYLIREGESVTIKYNAGVAIFPYDGESFNELYSAAVLAMREAKSLGPNTIVLYNKERAEKVKGLIEAEHIVDRALKEGLFVFFYQPYYDIKTMQIVGLEALVRIRLPDGKILPPSTFIDFLELGPYHYIRNFEEWAIDYLSKKAVEWGIPISVNISARTITKGDSIKFLMKLAELLSKEKVSLVVEITERAMAENPGSFIEYINTLKYTSDAFKVAMDDFGIGYSALSYLKDLNVDVLKLDMSFVQAIDKDQKSKKFLNAVIQMARYLGFKTLAEGVETYDQLSILKEMGCDYAQGYYLCKPLPEDDIKELLKYRNL